MIQYAKPAITVVFMSNLIVIHFYYCHAVMDEEKQKAECKQKQGKMNIPLLLALHQLLVQGQKTICKKMTSNYQVQQTQDGTLDPCFTYLTGLKAVKYQLQMK